MVKLDFTNKAEEKTMKLKIYDYVGKYESINTNYIEKELKEAKDKPLDIHINSYGGEVFEGFAIYNMLKQYKGVKTVYVDGIAASIASVIAMAGDRVVMSEASMFMIHNASGGAMGTYKELQEVAEALLKINGVIQDIYLNRVNIDKDKLIELMDNESYLTAKESLEYGFCDEILEDEQSQAEEENIENKATTINLLMNQLDQRIATLNELKSLQEISNEFNKDVTSNEDENIVSEAVNEDCFNEQEVVENEDETSKTTESDTVVKEENALKRFFNITK